MEVATTDRTLAGDKAQRIVDAMRASVATRGVAGSTFDHVAREAGVSRGLLHYYFGTKERLLAEVVRRDTDVRMEALDARVADARSADDVVRALVVSLDELVQREPEYFQLVFELFTLSRRNEELREEFAGMVRRTRSHFAALLAGKQDEGVVDLRAAPEAVAELIFSLADGIALRMLSDCGHDFAAVVDAGADAVRRLLAPA